jgi:hypothetical protein
MKGRCPPAGCVRAVAGTVAALVCLLSPRCTPPPPGKGVCNGELPVPPVHITAAEQVVAEADLLISAEGKEYRLRADISWRPGGRFMADFYGMFGAAVLSVVSEQNAGEVSAQGRTYYFSKDDPIGSIGGLSALPFTFGDFIRILQGTFVAKTAERARMDTLAMERRRVQSELSTGSFRISVTQKTGVCRTERICYESRLDGGWRLVFEDFRDGMPRRTEFSSETNYFVLKHRIIKGIER